MNDQSQILEAAPAAPSAWERMKDSHLWHSFSRDRVAQLSFAIFVDLRHPGVVRATVGAV